MRGCADCPGCSPSFPHWFEESIEVPLIEACQYPDSSILENIEVGRDFVDDNLKRTGNFRHGLDRFESTGNRCRVKPFESAGRRLQRFQKCLTGFDESEVFHNRHRICERLK